jgi:hypothetical protein
LDDLIIGVNDDSNKEGKAYVIFGKQDNKAIELSAIVAGTGGFVINGESKRLSNQHYDHVLTRH